MQFANSYLPFIIRLTNCKLLDGKKQYFFNVVPKSIFAKWHIVLRRAKWYSRQMSHHSQIFHQCSAACKVFSQPFNFSI
jgi:hypothetical protein